MCDDRATLSTLFYICFNFLAKKNDHICRAPTGAVFSEPAFFTNLRCQARPIPHTSSHMSGHHLATVRRAGRKRGAIFESSEALAEQPAVRLGCYLQP